MPPLNDRLAAASRAFLESAWPVLIEEHILPRPRYDIYIHVGHDYEGRLVMHLPEYERLEEVIQSDYSRFHPDRPLRDRDFASSYIFSFLEYFVARVLRAGKDFTSAEPEVQEAVEHLETAVMSESREIASCRLVSHLTVRSKSRLDFAGVQVIPLTEEASGHRGEIARLFESVIPRSSAVYNRFDPFIYAPPESIVVARGVEDRTTEEREDVGKEIDHFLLLVRLLKASTCTSAFGVRGEVAQVRDIEPSFVQFRGAGPGWSSPVDLVRRTATLDASDIPRFEGLSKLIRSVPEDKGAIISSFGMGLHKFQLSYHAHAWHEQLVDLATSLEAMLSGTSTTDVTLRLKMRAAALLSVENDPAPLVFADVGHLYVLRSKLVHGGSLTEKELRKTVYAISTVPASESFGTAISYAVDRLRDFVRRSILVRLCLAAEGNEMWLLGSDSGVDASLATDEAKEVWRDACRKTLEGFDAAEALNRPQKAVWHVSPDEAE